MPRWLNLLIALALAPLLLIPFLVIVLLVRVTSPGPVLHWSSRVGRDNGLFQMPKFRTMKVGTPNVATHLLTDPDQYVTAIGKVLRKTSLDELPQLWNILTGEMCFVGPRPALYNQEDLIQMRTERGIPVLVPGITGWAQVQGRDDLPIPQKVDMDEYYLRHRSLALDLKILWLTVIVVFKKKGISH